MPDQEVETFIVTHNQDLIEECETQGKYNILKSYKWLFVGNGPIDKLTPEWRERTIVVREYEPNFEHYPHFYDFTAWWVLYKHNLVKSPYMISLQYDMTVLRLGLEEAVLEHLKPNPTMLAFTPAGRYHFVMHDLIPAYNLAMATVNSPDIDSLTPGFETWPTTQGTAWSTECFYKFMEWFEPLFEALKDDVWCGHIAERMVYVFLANHQLQANYMTGWVQHYSCNVHGTAKLWGQGRIKFNDEQERATFF